MEWLSKVVVWNDTHAMALDCTLIFGHTIVNIRNGPDLCSSEYGENNSLKIPAHSATEGVAVINDRQAVDMLW
jgi:hypothetical protein